MNTEATQDHQEANTTGARLRHAREQLGLSQQAVAERLCLKVSTVRDIEDDKAPPTSPPPSCAGTSAPTLASYTFQKTSCCR